MPGEILTGESGEQYELGDLIGTTGARTPCDAAEFGGAPSYADGHCRCIVCARCGHHTGNSNQGHYWASCKVLAAKVSAELAPGETLTFAEYMKRTTREFHMCCDDPAYGCELEAAARKDGTP